MFNSYLEFINVYTNILNQDKSYIYIVQKGDNLQKIAKKYGISLAELVQLNNIQNINLIRIGQQLIIPNKSNSNEKVTVITIKPGDNYTKLAKQYKTTVTNIIKANPNINPNKLQIGQKLNIPAATNTSNSQAKSPTETNQFIIVIIQRGDNFTKLAKKYGTTVNNIEKANPGIKSKNLKIGQKIKIPKHTKAKGKILSPQENEKAIDIAIDFIKLYEGKVIDKNGMHLVYDDQNNKNRFNSDVDTLDEFLSSVLGTPTIGYGTTDLEFIKSKNGKITQQEALDKLKQKVLETRDYMPNRFGESWNCLNRNQRAAIISFFYQQGKDQTKNPYVSKLIDAVKNNNLAIAGTYLNSLSSKQGIKDRRKAQQQLYKKQVKQ